MKAVFDTNILIDYLNGVHKAAAEFELYDERYISVITQIEVLVGADDAKEEHLIRRFLTGFKVRELSPVIAEATVRLRKEFALKVPDAIVYATAREEGCMLVTRNTRDFEAEWPDVREPYRL